MQQRSASPTRKTLSLVVISALLGLTPGPACYEASAAVVRAHVGAAGSKATTPVQAGIPAVSGFSTPVNLSNPGLSPALPGLPGLESAPALIPEVGVIVPVSGPDAASPKPAVPLQAPARRFPAPETADEADPSSLGVLNIGVEDLSRAEGESGRQNALDHVYLGGRTIAESEDIVSISAAPRFAAATPTLSPYRPLAAAPAGIESGKPLAELEASANDPALPFAERVAVVTAIAATVSDEAKAVLKAVGRANPEGGALDYEVKRKALQALAALGEVVSLPPVSRSHADEILKSLTEDKPEAAVFDYDDTLERNQRRASPRTAAALESVSDAGVETMVLTARSDRPDDVAGKTVLDSLSTLTPKQKRGLVIGASRGARILVFDRKGKARLVASEPAWTEAERRGIQEAARVVKARYGEAMVERAGLLTDYSFSIYLPVGTSPADVAAAAQLLEAELARRGVRPAAISGRGARNPARPSFLVVSKYDKSLGVARLRADRDYYARLRDVFQRLPSWLQGLSANAAARLPRAAAPGEKVLMVGDHFLGSRVEDLNMTKAAPEGLSLAVGGVADPRVERVFVWPSRGFSATQEIMAALSARGSGGVDKKAVGGLFAQRTLSIIAFVLTSVAYPFVAIPVVGVAGFGALMALGPLAAIATGPLNGYIAKRLSARNAMALNTVVRAVLAASMPLLAAFGLMSFWTLLLASIANGWVSSSVITTENIYVKRLSGKHLGAFNALAWINYVVIQVAMGLIVGVGSLVDKFNPMLPYWFSTALNLGVILPIIWKTIPNRLELSPGAASALAKASTWLQGLKERLARVPAFLKTYWKEALMFAAGLGSYFVVHSTLPATLALLNWITRTGGFRQLWADKPLRNGLLFLLAGAFLFFPLQYFGLPLMAETLAGKAGEAELLSNLLGALFFGQLISNTSQAALGSPRIPFLGRVSSQRLIQLGVLGLTAAWVFLRLYPGNWLALAPSLAVAAVLMALSGRMTNRGWIKYLGAGFAFITLPLLFWGNIPVLFFAVLMMGLFFGPANVALSSYFYKNTPKGQTEKFIGIQSSLFNAAVSLGYGIFSYWAGLHSPALPGMLLPVAISFAGAGALFFLAPRFLKGLPEKSLQPKKT